MALAGGLTRRGFVLLALAGCAQVRHGDLPAPESRAAEGANHIRIAIFELAGLDVPFHTGLILRHDGQTTIYDPAGQWQPLSDACTREGEVIRNVTPEDEEGYLARTGIRYSVGGWVVHLFDRPVSAGVARLALERLESRDLSLPLHCSYNVSSVLAGLPGFEGIEPHRITAQLLADLLARDDLTYTRRDLRAAQSG